MIEKLKNLQIGEVREQVDLKNENTYRVSCIANYYVKPKDLDSLIRLLKFLKQEQIPYKVLGNGSNVLFVSPTYEGAIIKLDFLNHITIEETKVLLGAGVNLVFLANTLAQKGWSGLEFASGIPGLIGASVAMNIGAHGSEIADIVTEVKVLTPEFTIKTLSKEDLEFSYRDSFLKRNKEYIVLEVALELQRKNPKTIQNTMKEYKEERIKKQPLEYPSAGSVFRNPTNDSAGRIIESLGLKGKRIGGAEVSTKHANFIINTGNATGKDIYDLILYIQKSVKEKENIDFILEQELIQ